MSENSIFEPYKLIVGVDYGTTYSGISYVMSHKTGDDIVIVTRWPNHRDQAWKAPSTIAYSAENRKLSRNHWGYEVTRAHKQYTWTKLLLDKSVKLTEYDDPLLREMYGAEGFLGLPHGKTAQNVVTDYFRELYKHILQNLEREFSPEILRALPMDCWITMPAIWSDGAQKATLDAALQAGFGSRPSDRVSMISEPEAAALWALRPYLSSTSLDPLKPHEHVLICDCGGGTVDLITYEILTIQPLTHKEKCVGTGAKCGATAIDRQFVRWMEATFGNAYTSLDVKKRGPGSLFMQSFESEKRNFGDTEHERGSFEIGPIVLELDAPSIKYDEDEQVVRLSRHEMQSFFDPPISDLISKIDEQKEQLSRKHAKIDRFILVGGFGDSPYLNTRLKAWCSQNNVRRFTCPTDCQAAIVKGAVLRGLEGICPQSVIAKRHYGWRIARPFREGEDDEEHAFTHKYYNTKYCSGRMNWAVAKGDELDATFKFNKGITVTKAEADEYESNLHLYSCPIDNAPDHHDHVSVQREGTITTKFNNAGEAHKSKYNKRLETTVYRFHYEVQVTFRSDAGILGFKSFRNGREAGATSVRFDGY